MLTIFHQNCAIARKGNPGIRDLTAGVTYHSYKSFDFNTDGFADFSEPHHLASLIQSVHE
jgi:hypothetical protein